MLFSDSINIRKFKKKIKTDIKKNVKLETLYEQIKKSNTKKYLITQNLGNWQKPTYLRGGHFLLELATKSFPGFGHSYKSILGMEHH